MSDPAKVRKHAERVRELVASAVRTQIKDPRLGMVTITDARITADLREATVFYTVLGDVEEQQSTAAALESAKGMLRGPVGRALGLRHSPSLAFVMDNVQETVKHIDDLLAEAKIADAKVHEIAERATYAGDPQPYKLDDDADEADDDDEDEPARAAEVGR
ncbi:ribosome-binding factor A [Allocatelliglobosispora scoriae]|uniref:Ribosome-binding factor A n=1 Tax=Allocatelliglobosispora scoriae TaxID=643052 RepID=A0A841BT76_9ACTN|nr:30S ribosome-binding factor RbfA [Allocatelliglobosispora scoriae]MBB5872287.1 ribosome-binding factor A [Allocatelliglobosispora scoriae]